MKCLSLWQPWASYIANGQKLIETRHWSTRYRGPLLIHAAKTKESCSRSQIEEMPFGAIICLVDMIDCQRAEILRDQITDLECGMGNYGDGRFGWMFTNVRTFAPIPYKGQQGLFDVDVTNMVLEAK